MDEQPIVVVLPRFSRWMKALSIAVGSIWLAEIVLSFMAPGLVDSVLEALALIPARVIGARQLWRLVSYGLIEDPKGLGVIWTVVGFWWLGSPLEREAGPARTVQLLAAGLVGGAAFAVLAYAISPSLARGAEVGLGAATSALLAGWGFLYAEQPVSFFGIGPLKGRQLALGLAAITTLMALFQRSTSGFAAIGGLLGGAALMAATSRSGGPGARRPPPNRQPETRARPGRLRSIRGGRADEADKKMWN